jgi:hypothetical protein
MPEHIRLIVTEGVIRPGREFHRGETLLEGVAGENVSLAHLNRLIGMGRVRAFNYTPEATPELSGPSGDEDSVTKAGDGKPEPGKEAPGKDSETSAPDVRTQDPPPPSTREAPAGDGDPKAAAVKAAAVKAEAVKALVEKHSRNELIALAKKEKVTFSSRANMTHIATEIVEARIAAKK